MLPSLLKEALLYGNEDLGLSGSILVVGPLTCVAACTSTALAAMQILCGSYCCLVSDEAPVYALQGNEHESLWFGQGCLRRDKTTCYAEGEGYFEVRCRGAESEGGIDQQ